MVHKMVLAYLEAITTVWVFVLMVSTQDISWDQYM